MGLPSPSCRVILTIVFLLALFILPWNSFTAEENRHFTEECLDCHEDYDKTLEGSVHKMQDPDHASPVMCTHCHGGAEVHMDDPEVSNITNPSHVTTDMAAAICRTCHYTDHQQHMGERNIHSENNISCGSCHKIHENNQLSLLKNKESELCYECHTGVRGEFAYPYRHPVQDGIMTCSECHKDLDRIGGALTVGESSKPCYDCHNEFQGPFPYEHQASVDYSTEEGGCLNCHAAHGSNNPRLLNQPLNPPNYALCAQCHMIPPGHRYNSYHEDRWADRECGSCHVDIHGSYFNKQFLKSSLPDEEGSNCFASGCHGS